MCIRIRFLIAALCLTATLQASTIASASASWSGFTCTPGIDGLCITPSAPVGDSIDMIGTDVLASIALPSPGLGGASGSATAEYGALHAYSYANAGVPASDARSFYVADVQSAASASFTDTITIFGGTGSGLLQFGILVNCRDIDEGHASASLFIGAAHQTCMGSYHAYDFSAAFTFGVPLSISGSATTSAHDYSPSDPGDGAGDGTATVRISSLIVLDGSGNRLAGITYDTGSEARYAFENAVHAPEPGTAWLVLLFLAGSAWVKRVPNGQIVDKTRYAGTKR